LEMRGFCRMMGAELFHLYSVFWKGSKNCIEFGEVGMLLYYFLKFLLITNQVRIRHPAFKIGNLVFKICEFIKHIVQPEVN
jgi:hypothetical protein